LATLEVRKKVAWNTSGEKRARCGVEHSDDCVVIDLEDKKIKSWREYFDFGGSIEAKP
jgi:limonene-1,2-epoxide hydrolase